MTKKRKKIISKVIASGMLVSNMPIQTFANEIEGVILDTSNIEENIDSEEIINSEEEIINSEEDKTEIIDSNESENENTLSEDSNLNDSQLTEETLNTESSSVLDVNDDEKSITTKDVVNNKYVINTLDDLKQLRTEINTNNLDTTDMIIELGADIDFTGETSWESIGTTKNQFKGTFDGNNYTIRNLNISGQFSGLFDNASNPTFKNINFENININSQSLGQVGIVVGLSLNGLNVNNLNFKNVSLVVEKANYTGGIAGISPTGLSYISNIVFNGNVSGISGYAGGLIGMGAGNFSDIKISGEVIGGSSTGGAIGILTGPSKSISRIENVDINAYIEVMNISSTYAGGVVGQVPSAVSFNNITVNGDYIGSKNTNSNAGGIMGGIMDYSNVVPENSISNCIINTKKINGSTAGGVFGSMNSGNKLNVENTKVYSNIEGENFIGGIGGINSSYIIVQNSLVKNEFIKGNNEASGILAISTGVTYLENNNVESNIISSNSASGIVNRVTGVNSSTIINNSFKGKIEATSDTGKSNGLSTQWTVSNSTVSGNKIEAEIISKGDESSGLIGNITTGGTIIVDNTIEANISGKNRVGGLIGYGTIHSNSKVQNNYINVIINANNEVGGLGGYIINGIIENNKIISNIIANDSVGGIVGYATNQTAIYSKNIVSTSILANSKIGGMIGSGNPVKTNNNFIEGRISGKSQIGGVIGYISGTIDSPIIEDSVVALTIEGETLTNSIVGETVDDIITQNVYYDTNLTNLTDNYGIGLTTNQMQGKEALNNMNLNFTDIWKLNKEFYPTFEQLNSAPDIIPSDKVVDSTITINQYDKFNPLDYVTTEDFEGDEVTLSIKIAKESFDTSKYGIFPITYVATDSKGLSTELTLNVKINPLMITLNSIPVIVAEDRVLTVGDEFNPLKMTVAYDKEDGIITDSIKITENTVDMSKPGLYKVVYEITDKDGAKATKTITVTVKEKTVSNNNQNNNGSNSNTADKDTNTTEKPQTSDIGFIGLISALISIIGLYTINRKNK